MTVKEEPITEEDVRHIVNHLRERDYAEIMALRWDDDREALIRDIGMVAGAMWRVWRVDGEPASIAGVTPIRPGVVVVGCFGTDKWPKTAKHILRWSRDWAWPRLHAAHFHRAECYALATYTDGRKFIEAAGGEVEALMRGYGRAGQDYLLYAWRLDDVLQWRKGSVTNVLDNKRLPVWRKSARGRRSRFAANCH